MSELFEVRERLRDLENTSPDVKEYLVLLEYEKHLTANVKE